MIESITNKELQASHDYWVANFNEKQKSIDNGQESIQCDRIKGKNSTDIKMAVDIMKALYNISHITLFYIVASDSDYRHVIPEIKLCNKKIYCIGSKNANKSIQSLCDLIQK